MARISTRVLGAPRDLVEVITVAMSAGIVIFGIARGDRVLLVAGAASVIVPLGGANLRALGRSRGLVVVAGLLVQSVLLSVSSEGLISPALLALCVVCVAALFEDAVVMSVAVASSVVVVGGLAVIDPGLLDLEGAGAVRLWSTVIFGALVTAVAATAVTTLWLEARRAAGRAQEHVRRIEAYLEVAGSMLLVLDRDAIVKSANRQTCLVLEREMEDIQGRNWLEFSIPPDAIAATTEAYRHAVDHDEVQTIYENEVIAATGERRQIRWYSLPHRDQQGRVTGMICSGTDITDQRTAERTIERGRRELEALARLARKVASLDDARQAIVEAALELVGARYVAIAEPATGHRQTLQYLTATDDRHLGRPVPAEPGEPGLIAQAYLSGRRQFVNHAFEVPKDPFSGDSATIKAVLHQPIVGAAGVVGVLSVAWDHEIKSIASRESELVGIIAHEAAVALRRRDSLAALERAALVDPLTGIANRRAFDAELPRALARATATGEPLSLIVMDLNEFKAVNDLQGHEAGDELLTNCANAWTHGLRTGDLLARIGGDEFTALLPRCQQPELTEIARRLRAATPHHAGTSIGAATWNTSEPAADLIRRADQNQYEDKATGKARRANRPDR